MCLEKEVVPIAKNTEYLLHRLKKACDDLSLKRKFYDENRELVLEKAEEMFFQKNIFQILFNKLKIKK